MTTVIQVENLSKHFVIRKEKSLKERVVNFGRSQKHREDFWALRDINLEIASGSTVGLIGPNGSGKSTLLKMVGGILQPDSGNVRIRGRIAALLELGAGFHPDLTGRENVYLNASILGLSKQQIDRYFDAIVDFSGIEAFIDTQVKFYSSGMYVRLAFAVAVHVDPDILLVDEVLAVGDEPFQRKCLERIRQFQSEGRTIVMVTHGLDQVAEFCDRAVVLEKGRIAADGTPREALRTLRADFEEARQEERERAYEASAPETRAGRVNFTGIALSSTTGDGGHPTIATGDGLLVTMELEAETPTAGCVVEIGIATPLGVVVYSTTTALLEATVPELGKVNRYQVFFPELHLGEGEYSIQVGLTLEDGTELHRIPEAGQFTVEGNGRGRGVLHTIAHFSIAPMPSINS
jgi:ABC-2 type transport system ATP-binding protein